MYNVQHMCNIRTTYIWALGAGPKKATGDPGLGPMGQGPGPWAHGPSRLFGPGHMGPYVFCTYVAHMLYIIHIYLILISYLFYIYFIFIAFVVKFA